MCGRFVWVANEWTRPYWLVKSYYLYHNMQHGQNVMCISYETMTNETMTRLFLCFQLLVLQNVRLYPKCLYLSFIDKANRDFFSLFKRKRRRRGTKRPPVNKFTATITHEPTTLDAKVIFFFSVIDLAYRMISLKCNKHAEWTWTHALQMHLAPKSMRYNLAVGSV